MIDLPAILDPAMTSAVLGESSEVVLERKEAAFGRCTADHRKAVSRGVDFCRRVKETT